MKYTVSEVYNAIQNKIETSQVRCFKGMDKPVFLISEQYPGVWMEHVYDSVMYAKLYPEKIDIAVNTVKLFIDHQTDKGQLPCYIWDGNIQTTVKEDDLIGYGQIQECVSFYRLALEICKMAKDDSLIAICYESGKRWIDWLRSYRMTMGKGLIEAFVGYDMGHDNSGRYEGLHYKGARYTFDREVSRMERACIPPEEDDIAPLLAVDMNANYFKDIVSISEMAALLGKEDEAAEWMKEALSVKENMFKYMYDKEDAFFYDVDKFGNKRKYLSSTILHLLLEGVLDKNEDKALIKEICERHIKNPNEFWTKVPFPSMAISDKSFKKHTPSNCWGYFSQALIALRTTLWMDEYGMSAEQDEICKIWVERWTDAFDNVKLGQEFDPITGEPSDSSEWYSTAMLFYTYSARRLKLV